MRPNDARRPQRGRTEACSPPRTKWSNAECEPGHSTKKSPSAGFWLLKVCHGLCYELKYTITRYCHYVVSPSTRARSPLPPYMLRRRPHAADLFRSPNCMQWEINAPPAFALLRPQPSTVHRLALSAIEARSRFTSHKTENFARSARCEIMRNNPHAEERHKASCSSWPSWW
jgi:hypothetical protein